MGESERGYLNRIAKSRVAATPRLEAADAAAADQAARFKTALERLEAARQAAAPAGDDELSAVKLAVDRVRVEVGRRAD